MFFAAELAFCHTLGTLSWIRNATCKANTCIQCEAHVAPVTDLAAYFANFYLLPAKTAWVEPGFILHISRNLSTVEHYNYCHRVTDMLRPRGKGLYLVTIYCIISASLSSSPMAVFAPLTVSWSVVP